MCQCQMRCISSDKQVQKMPSQATSGYHVSDCGGEYLCSTMQSNMGDSGDALEHLAQSDHAAVRDGHYDGKPEEGQEQHQQRPQKKNAVLHKVMEAWCHAKAAYMPRSAGSCNFSI